MNISLNLLPPIKKKGLQKSLFLAFFQTLSVLFFAVTVALVATVLLVRNQMLAGYQELKQRSAVASSGAAVSIMTDIKQTNTFLRETEALQTRFVPWSDVVEKITALIPPGARLNNLEFDSTGAIRLRGLAATREDALAMIKGFKETPYLTDLVSPLSNILQKDNISFDFSMKYAEPAAAGQ